MNTIKYHASPRLKWTTELGSQDILLEGNAVVQSPFDSSVLYVTTRNGKLLALDADTGHVVDRVSPVPKSLSSGGSTRFWDMYASSGISFGRLDDGSPILVYSVNDVPPEGVLSHERKT